MNAAGFVRTIGPAWDYSLRFPEIGDCPAFRVAFIIVLSSIGGLGCARVQRGGETNVPIHHVYSAETADDSLVIFGTITPYLYAYTDHGIRIYNASDDRGKTLGLQSFEFWQSKEHCFRLVLDPPSKGAQLVSIDVGFSTRAGVQRIQRKLPIEWNARSSYRIADLDWKNRKLIAK